MLNYWPFQQEETVYRGRQKLDSISIARNGECQLSGHCCIVGTFIINALTWNVSTCNVASLAARSFINPLPPIPLCRCSEPRTPHSLRPSHQSSQLHRLPCWMATQWVGGEFIIWRGLCTRSLGFCMDRRERDWKRKWFTLFFTLKCYVVARDHPCISLVEVLENPRKLIVSNAYLSELPPLLK